MILSDTRPGGETNAIDTLPRCILHNMMGHTSPGVKYSFVTAFATIGVNFLRQKIFNGDRQVDHTSLAMQRSGCVHARQTASRASPT